jgi:hypothetical protein
MQNVTANQPFYGSRQEGMWAEGDTREVSPERAKELHALGLVEISSGEKEEKPAESRKTKEDKPVVTTKHAK